MFLTLETKSRKGRNNHILNFLWVILEEEPITTSYTKDVGTKVDWRPTWIIEVNRLKRQIWKSLIIWNFFLQ
jgi:hypothetical protein